MALQLQIQNTEVGAAFDAAYAKIVHFEGHNDGSGIVHFVVDFYADQAARDSNLRRVSRAFYDSPVPDGHITQSLYAYLKTLPEFAGAVDC
jgi:hypothetical protein